MNLIALWIGKLTLILLRLLGKRGSSFPGLVVEKVSDSFLAAHLSDLKGGVVVVSGTNGKTTTTKMISAIMSTKYHVLTNPTGANFTRGIASSIVAEANWFGRLPHTAAVFELDEAWAVQFCRQVAPRGVLVTNVMRDQMDRFGEIDTTARMLGEVVSTATGFVVLNADDPRVRAMVDEAKASVTFFGVGERLRSVFISDDELYVEDLATADKLAARPAPDFILEAVEPGKVSLVASGKPFEIGLQVFGSHNAQNATAALAVAAEAGIPINKAIGALEQMRAAFGRGEYIDLNGRRILMQLVKNPGGFRYALMDVSTVSPAGVLIVINDDYADGRDVSWLWDVDFTGLADYPLAVSGTRATDMELRLRYDGLDVQWCEPDLRASIARISREVPEGSTIVVCATYTAMFDMRAVLATMTEVEAV